MKDEVCASLRGEVMRAHEEAAAMSRERDAARASASASAAMSVAAAAASGAGAGSPARPSAAAAAAAAAAAGGTSTFCVLPPSLPLRYTVDCPAAAAAMAAREDAAKAARGDLGRVARAVHRLADRGGEAAAAGAALAEELERVAAAPWLAGGDVGALAGAVAGALRRGAEAAGAAIAAAVDAVVPFEGPLDAVRGRVCVWGVPRRACRVAAPMHALCVVCIAVGLLR